VSVRKTDVFIVDLERQFEWYARNADWKVAERYLDAVEGSCRLVALQPRLGPRGSFTHPLLHHWRFFVVFPPFKKHILFYEVTDNNVLMRRAMQGHRDLPRRLLEPPVGE